MKNIYTLLILVFSASAFAAPINTVVVNNGNWNIASTWSLNKTPIDGDTVVIPSGKTVIINNNQNYSSSTLYIRVNGTLSLTQSANLSLGINSVIKVNTGGVLSGDPSDNDVANATIFIGAVKKYSDAVGKINGPAIANKTTGTGMLGFSSFSLLAEVFINFTAVRNSDNTVELTWKTAVEVNIKHYVVEKSINGANWNEIAVVASDNDPRVHSYQYADRNSVSGTAYYRIRQVDLDGKYYYTSITEIKEIFGKPNTGIFNANKNVTIRFSNEVKNEVEVRLITMTGNVLLKRNLSNPTGNFSFSAGNVSNGIYIVQVVDNHGLIAIKEIVLN